MRRVIMKILTIINMIVPKKNRAIFGSFPSLSGNALALYQYILEERPDISRKYELVWSVGNEDYEETLNRIKAIDSNFNHKVVKRSSVSGILSFMRSSLIISTHGFYPEIDTSKKQKHINLWHGMPFKKIGLAVGSHIESKKDKADITIATSELFQKCMAEAFGLENKDVWITGQPCNDILLKENHSLQKLGINKDKYNQIIVWMPTYRKSIVGDIRSDGDEESFGVVDVLSNHLDVLNQILDEKGYLLLVKPHPMDVVCKMKFESASNVKVILNQELDAANVILYELLSESSVLLTDYSSVFIDYMVTDKPMAFVCDDIDTYASSRGFFFENPIDYMPGELIGNSEELIHYFKNMDAINAEWREKYRNIKAIFNPYSDTSASERVCNHIWGEQKMSNR